MNTIGLTGAPGAGKSLAAEYLRAKGAVIISGDEAGRQVIRRYPSTLRKLTRVFGDSIQTDDGILDRRKLGRLVFGDPLAMKKLNAIIHPNLLRILKSEIKKTKSRKKRGLVVVDAALIFEWGIEKWFDTILVITAMRETRIQRLLDSGLTRKEAVSRIGSQIHQRRKAAMADYVIENNGNRSQLKRGINRFLKSLEESER